MAGSRMNICWNTHLDSLGAAFPQMLLGRKFVDVTLACGGYRIHCHRVVLAACSVYFADLLEENPAQHPIIILPKDVKFWVIQALVQYMYKGEVSVREEGFEELVRCAEMLQIHSLNKSTAFEQSGYFPETSHNEKFSDEKCRQFKAEILENGECSEEWKRRDEMLSEACSRSTVSAKEEPKETRVSGEIKSPLMHAMLKQREREAMSGHRQLREIERKSYRDCKTEDEEESEESDEPREDDTPLLVNPFSKASPPPPKDFILRQNNNRNFSRESLWAALMAVKAGLTIKGAAKVHNISHSTIHTYMKRYGIQSAFTRPPTKKSKKSKKSKRK